MKDFLNFLVRFFGVVIRGQTYLNMLYLFLAFPLGLAYFVFFVTGLSAGLGLLIVWVGLLILAGVIAAWYGLIVFERNMAIWLLHEQIPPVQPVDLSGKTMWQKFKATMGNTVMWKGLAYLFAKFPLGIVSFCVLVTFLSVSLALVGAPFYYNWFHPVVDLGFRGTGWQSVMIVDTLGEALLASVGGLILLLVSLHLFNGLAWISGKFARVMLGYYAPATTAVVAAPEPVVATQPMVEAHSSETVENKE
jgi:hypothetical protein